MKNMINRDEMIKTLHKIFTGNENKKNSKLKEILEETNNRTDALKKAYEYLNYGKNGQENCKSDFSYWAYAGDITLAEVIISILLYEQKGNTDFPELPDVSGNVLMDKQDILSEWAYSLGKDHKCEYETITLRRGEKNDDYPDGCEFAYTVYDKCTICGHKDGEMNLPSFEEAMRIGNCFDGTEENKEA